MSRAREGGADAVGEPGLVARAQNGDTEAFDALVARHLGRVYRLAYRFCWNHDDADDITQDTFVRAFKYLRRLRAGAEFAPWLHRIAVNRCLSHRARRQRAAEAEPQAAPPVRLYDDPETLAETSAARSRVREEIRQLPKRQRAAMVLFELEGCTVEETAQAMGCSAGTVKRHLHRARVALRERLMDLLADASDEGC
ncbi:MAG: sigma-70 family RNA polymerase sigma factor [Armatimonadota bacterium]